MYIKSSMEACMLKLLLSEKISEKAIKLLKDAGFLVKISPSTDEEVMEKEVRDVDAVLVRTTPITKKIMDSGKKLQIIARHGTGIDNIDVVEATKKGILVTNVDGANAYSVAEYVVASMLTLSRKLYKSNHLFTEGRLSVKGSSLPALASRYDLNGSEIRGKKLAILGLGKVGIILASLAEKMGVQVVAYDPYLTKSPVPLIPNLTEIYKTADFISINMPLTSQTKNMITKKELQNMKKSTFIINAGRGGIINEQDLADALNEELIAGAAVDVFLPEPPEKNNPLLTAKNSLLTCHIAGTTIEAIESLGIEAANSIIDYFNGQMPKFPVNPEIAKELRA